MMHLPAHKSADAGSVSPGLDSLPPGLYIAGKDGLEYIGPVDPDFRVTGHGSIYLLSPVSEAAQAWCDEHLPEDAQTFGAAFAVEHRYINDIIAGIQADGLEVA